MRREYVTTFAEPLPLCIAGIVKAVMPDGERWAHEATSVAVDGARVVVAWTVEERAKGAEAPKLYKRMTELTGR